MWPAEKKFGDSDLTNNVRFLLSVADFANHDKFVFSWPPWTVYGFAIATKESKSRSHQSRLQPGGGERFASAQIAVEKCIKWRCVLFINCGEN